MNNGSDVEVGECLAIVFMESGWLGCESGLVQDAIEKMSGAIAGKRPAGAVGSVSAGSKAENKQPGVGIAEAGDGPGPVVPIKIGAAFDLSNLLAVFHKSSAARAGSDFVVQDNQIVFCLRGRRHPKSSLHGERLERSLPLRPKPVHCDLQYYGSRLRIAAMRMIYFEHGVKGVKKVLRAVQWVHMCML